MLGSALCPVRSHRNLKAVLQCLIGKLKTFSHANLQPSIYTLAWCNKSSGGQFFHQIGFFIGQFCACLHLFQSGDCLCYYYQLEGEMKTWKTKYE